MAKHKHGFKNPPISVTIKTRNKLMSSQWLNDTLASILAIAIGGATDAQTQVQVATLTKQLGTDEGNQAATNAEFQTAITALVKQLAAAPAPTGPVPVVSSVSPTTGAIAGNQPFTVTGSGFSKSTPVVNMGAVAGTNVAVQSDTSLTFTSAAQAAGVYDVTVSTTGGISAPTVADQVTLA